MWLGSTHNYHWMVARNDSVELAATTLINHGGQILHITSFDSGPLTPTNEELKAGWHQDGEITLSPPLRENLEVPYDQYDEWYISSGRITFPDEFEIFVNYSDFNLASPLVLTMADDPTWETGKCDYLYPMQERFWSQLIAINPETYVSIGDLDIAVSKNRTFIDGLQKSA